ncbi:MAG: pyruvate kinase, partial [Saprospiraceae bacterium]|nr:pyruvate kinase [Saprospiraceae bacterium]
MAAADKIKGLITELEEIIATCKQHEEHYAEELAKVHPRFAYSARNLAHYRAFRRKARNRLQKKLMHLGLSRLAKVESHVLPSLQTTQQLLQMLAGSQYQSTFDAPEFSIKKARRLLKRNVRTLLNKRPKMRRSRIMVTMPTEAAHDPKLVQEMLEAGMNVARINCAHDNPAIWKAMIENVRSVSAQLTIPCVVAMDLGGPKIRTGLIEPGPELRKIRPPKNARGIVIRPADVWLGDNPPQEFKHQLPIEAGEPLTPVQLLYFTDARDKKRSLVVTEAREGGYAATLNKTSYFETGMVLYGDKDRTQALGKIGSLPAIDGSIFIMNGDLLRLTAEPVVARHR